MTRKCESDPLRGATGNAQLLLDDRLRRLIAGAVAEVDPRQIAIYRQLTAAQRMQQLAHLSDWLRRANLRRIEQRAAKVVGP